MSDELNVEPTVDPVVEPTEPVVEPTNEPGETLVTPPQDPVQKAKDISDDEAKTGAPETYEDFDIPEGVEFDEAGLKEYVAVAKQLNLSQTDAQALISHEATRRADYVEAQISEWKAVQDEWVTSVKSDKEIGGPAYDQSLSNAKKFLTAYGTPELIQALNDTGMGNHPEFVRAFARAGKAMGEDNLTIGGIAQTSRSPEDILFPNQSET